MKGRLMVYTNKVAAAIKVNGKVLREEGDLVTLPFGSEYSVLVKNLNSVRIQIKVSVDGTDATDGTWLVIGPNATIELERFIKGGNWQSGNRFKFIERTKGIESHRGIKVDDGLVRIEYQVEQVEVVETVKRTRYYDEYLPTEPWYPPHPNYPPWPKPWRKPWPLYKSSGGPIRSSSMGRGSTIGGSSMNSRGPIGSKEASLTEDFAGNDAGITVPGSQSNQAFYAAEWFKTTGHSEVIVLRLRGQVAGKLVVKAITVKTKPSCVTCGKTNKAGNQFCSSCGTALVMY